jgi:hypothetical protein
MEQFNVYKTGERPIRATVDAVLDELEKDCQNIPDLIGKYFSVRYRCIRDDNSVRIRAILYNKLDGQPDNEYECIKFEVRSIIDDERLPPIVLIKGYDDAFGSHTEMYLRRWARLGCKFMTDWAGAAQTELAEFLQYPNVLQLPLVTTPESLGETRPTSASLLPSSSIITETLQPNITIIAANIYGNVQAGNNNHLTNGVSNPDSRSAQAADVQQASESIPDEFPKIKVSERTEKLNRLAVMWVKYNQTERISKDDDMGWFLNEHAPEIGITGGVSVSEFKRHLPKARKANLIDFDRKSRRYIPKIGNS